MLALTDAVDKILGETKGFWVQTGILFVSAVAAIATIIYSVRSERRRGTVELTLHQENNTTLVKAQEFVIATRGSNINFLTFLNQRDSEEYLFIVKVLNNYEFVAAAIHEGALSETMYKKVWNSRFTRDWESLCTFVIEKRRVDQQPTLYSEYERLAKKWLMAK